jgi:hypothetical protein
MRPEQRSAASAEHFLSGKIEQDSAEQRLRDAHATTG